MGGFLASLQAITLALQLLTEIPGALGKLIESIEELISNESDPDKKAILEMKLAQLKEHTTEVA